jgi:hypothetical protein
MRPNRGKGATLLATDSYQLYRQLRGQVRSHGSNSDGGFQRRCVSARRSNSTMRWR